MCHGKTGCCDGGRCTTSWIFKILLIIGGINWGLIGLGMLLGSSDWNVIRMILGGIPTFEAIVYVLVGIGAVVGIFGCRCKKCASHTCAVDPKMDNKMEGSM